MLEADDLVILKRAFAFADHEFTRGFVYLTEESITSRIEEVDPSWAFDIMQVVHEGNNAICHARLTIKDVSRDGIGMQQILEKAGEPAKGAATDALKRCARLFGVGRYLLDAPKEGDEFKRWLADQQKNSRSAPSLPTTIVGDDLGAALDETLGIPPNSVVVTEVEVKLDKNGKPFLTFKAGETVVSAFSREPLRGVLPAEKVEELAMTGKHKLPSVRLIYKVSDDGKYKNLERAELVA